MKSIELTEEHRSKLIEMCNKLFPEFISCEWYEDGDGYDDYDILVFKNIKPPYLSIHWFEFCITHLCTKIGNSPSNSNNFDETTLRGGMYFNQEWMKNYHPVDYLYAEFKKLK